METQRERKISFQKVKLGNVSRQIALQLQLEKNMMAHENAMSFML